MKIAICEDEPAAMNILASKIQAYMKQKQINSTISMFSDGEVLLKHMEKHEAHFDAIYLDIKMDKLNGIDTAKAIRRTDAKTFIVFVTALKDYVFDAFDVDATNYLLKPIDDKKLFSTLSKILSQLNSASSRTLVICGGGKVEKIPFENIVYCEVLNHRIFVYENNCFHESSGKIEQLQKELNEDFFRCHRSYIVNLRFVEKYKEGFAHLTSMEKIPIATRRRQEFMKALLQFQRKEVR